MSGASLYFNPHPFMGILDESGQLAEYGLSIDERPKADTLNSAADDMEFAMVAHARQWG